MTQTVRARRPDYSQRHDAELVSLVLRGEGEAFRAIMQRYNRRLYRVARGVVRDDAEAEDVVQEAYVRAYAALGEFRGESGLATWLTRIVLNEAMGRLRRRRPTEELDVLDTIPQESRVVRSEEHTSELQSRQYLVCRLLLEKKHNTDNEYTTL